MSQAYPSPPPEKPSSELNTMGLVGLILSIMGFMTIVAAPIGLILSLMGLRHPQKGLAIAGTIVGIFSTLYAAVIAFIFLMYFGTLGACCCVALGAAREQQAQEQAAKEAVAPLLNLTADQIEIKGLHVPSFESGPQTTSGQAVYTDDAGAKKVVDFTATFEKVDGKWQAANPTIDSEPRDWVEFDIDEDYESDAWDERSDDESSDEFGDEGVDDTQGDDQSEEGDPVEAVFEETP